jgi:gliding motility-associated-like protein
VIWKPAPDSSCIGCLSQTWFPGSSRRYDVTIVDTFGCKVSASTIVNVDRDIHIFVPNIFSPNGDGINDVYRAKSNYQSIVEFDAYIFNRWGQKLYEWHDPAGGWDGKFNGKDVKQGVYFVLVKAKGADGRKYNIKKDVNLLRGYTESNGVNSVE